MAYEEDIEFTDQIDVRLVNCLATDLMVVNAARVSTQGIDAPSNTGERRGLINFLMKNRHGTPFEHNMFTFFIDAPIFVYREFHRHRIGWSYNEESGRYKELRGKFYIPNEHRNLVQTGKPGHYEFHPGTEEQYAQMVDAQKTSASVAYQLYQAQLELGIAKEVARMQLPVSTYSTMYATCNARSMMSFLSLRQAREQRIPRAVYDYIDNPDEAHIEWEGEAMFPSKPMHEINMVANAFESVLQEIMPHTWEAFKKNGYVAP